MRRCLSWYLERGERVSACKAQKGANFGRVHKECWGVLRLRDGTDRGKSVGMDWCQGNGERWWLNFLKKWCVSGCNHKLKRAKNENGKDHLTILNLL